MELLILDHSDEEDHEHLEEFELKRLPLEVGHEELDVPSSLPLASILPTLAFDVHIRDWLALLLLDVHDPIDWH